MRMLVLVCMVYFCGCSTDKQKVEDVSKDVSKIENLIIDYHKNLQKAYSGYQVNTDSLMDELFEPDVYYVTYWGNTEPIDSTKLRMRSAISLIKDFSYRIEGLQVKVEGNAAYAFFILRQTYTLNGMMMDEYLPTTYVLLHGENDWKVIHSHRSADFQTIKHLIEITLQRETTK